MSDKPQKDPEEAKGFKVFVSYAQEDAEFAKRLADTLEQRGLSCWVDTSQVKVGEPWREQIADAIKKAENFVVVVSGSTVGSSPWVSSEWSKIQESVWRREDASVFPVKIGPVELPPFLESWQSFDLERANASVDGITAAISERLKGGKPEEERKAGTSASTVKRFREIDRALTALHSEEQKK